MESNRVEFDAYYYNANKEGVECRMTEAEAKATAISERTTVPLYIGDTLVYEAYQDGHFNRYVAEEDEPCDSRSDMEREYQRLCR